MDILGSVFSAKGNAFSGGNISEYSGSLITKPTFFAYGNHLKQFATGGGIMGEAGPEFVLPAERGPGGYLGVRAFGGGWNTTPVVNIKVINESGSPVAAQSEAVANGSGGFDLEVIIGQVEQGLVSRAKQGKSQLMQYQQAAYGLDRANVLARGRGRA